MAPVTCKVRNDSKEATSPAPLLNFRWKTRETEHTRIDPAALYFSQESRARTPHCDPMDILVNFASIREFSPTLGR